MIFFRRSRGRRAPADDLMSCAACGSDFVSPVEWAEHDESRWWMRLRCGQCGAVRELVVPQETANRYDLALDRACDTIAATLARLERERMTADVEAFTAALQYDLIDAADFAAGTGPDRAQER